jgi:predicted RNA polymerase sigma factor
MFLLRIVVSIPRSSFVFERNQAGNFPGFKEDLLPSVKARLPSELGDTPGAATCYRIALERTCSQPERRFLQRRLEQLQ